MDDDEEDEGTSRKATSDVEMADPHENDEGDDAPSGEEQLGRGARQRAKVCACSISNRVSLMADRLQLKARRKAKAKS